MKTIQQQATEYAESIRPITGLNEHDSPYVTAFEHNSDIETAFSKGVEAAQTWIPIDEELPERITNSVKQANGNTLYFYEKYLIKGYYYHGDRIVREVVFTATYMPCSSFWYFNIDDPDAENSLPYKITHWRPIEYK